LATKDEAQQGYDKGYRSCAFLLLADGKYVVPSDCNTFGKGINYGVGSGNQGVLCYNFLSDAERQTLLKTRLYRILNVNGAHQTCSAGSRLATKDEAQQGYDKGYRSCAFLLLADGKYVVPSDCNTFGKGINYGVGSGNQGVLCYKCPSGPCSPAPPPPYCRIVLYINDITCNPAMVAAYGKMTDCSKYTKASEMMSKPGSGLALGDDNKDQMNTAVLNGGKITKGPGWRQQGAIKWTSIADLQNDNRKGYNPFFKQISSMSVVTNRPEWDCGIASFKNKNLDNCFCPIGYWATGGTGRTSYDNNRYDDSCQGGTRSRNTATGWQAASLSAYRNTKEMRFPPPANQLKFKSNNPKSMPWVQMQSAHFKNDAGDSIQSLVAVFGPKALSEAVKPNQRGFFNPKGKNICGQCSFSKANCMTGGRVANAMMPVMEFAMGAAIGMMPWINTGCSVPGSTCKSTMPEGKGRTGGPSPGSQCGNCNSPWNK